MSHETMFIISQYFIYRGIHSSWLLAEMQLICMQPYGKCHHCNIKDYKTCGTVHYAELLYNTAAAECIQQSAIKDKEQYAIFAS